MVLGSGGSCAAAQETNPSSDVPLPFSAHHRAISASAVAFCLLMTLPTVRRSPASSRGGAGSAASGSVVALGLGVDDFAGSGVVEVLRTGVLLDRDRQELVSRHTDQHRHDGEDRDEDIPNRPGPCVGIHRRQNPQPDCAGHCPAGSGRRCRRSGGHGRRRGDVLAEPARTRPRRLRARSATPGGRPLVSTSAYLSSSQTSPVSRWETSPSRWSRGCRPRGRTAWRGCSRPRRRGRDHRHEDLGWPARWNATKSRLVTDPGSRSGRDR